ncbi:metalloregulator ArsR/SmtB family transcription factor [Acetobacter fabarum]|jgi:DNA-binding transcriptional ArsR family regulator|uniref:ArsR/SmtB family transcription factor n=1 Tax=Acetobacter fabarum TaxID=483199 RepID=UPI00140519BD|nr:metalloregulator ArsR/SmtB family transcription factor [Acetobacter fabarum]MCP1227977.1 metalloregulator ArsR/SmtB family transcription factor [Acetobacter fabarum]MCP1233473.1 metalloregulator ArsR/SmtB family transcription factor [Acetobacter fabarum]NHO41717.1 metalloregulator ArsR/SmtB family transcription factor [Acetobacter fabarum]GBQ36675.1 ArsR family transcriptional regulator [Acetobacter fabarum DSM 19596]
MSALGVEEARQLVERMKLFAQPQRLMILDALLEQGSLAVGELESCTGIGQPTLSQQLGALRRAEIVVPRRESRTIHYSLASEEESLRVRALIGLLRGDRAALPALRAVSERYAASRRTTAQREAEGGAQFAFIRTPDVPRS